MSHKYIIGNWKLNPRTEKEAIVLFTQLKKELGKIRQKAIVCPPAIFIPALSKIQSAYLALGLQNTGVEDTGAYTGQVSIGTALSYKTQYCIVGHSEVRAQGETDDLIAKKLVYLLKNKVIPILCIGEYTRDNTHEYFVYVKNQLKGALSLISQRQIKQLIICYEPVWAIGKNALRDATGDEFLEMKIYINKVLKENFNVSHVPILYGGSVTNKNAMHFLDGAKADGLLIGRASLDCTQFVEIIKQQKKL